MDDDDLIFFDDPVPVIEPILTATKPRTSRRHQAARPEEQLSVPLPLAVDLDGDWFMSDEEEEDGNNDPPAAANAVVLRDNAVMASSTPEAVKTSKKKKRHRSDTPSAPDAPFTSKVPMLTEEMNTIMNSYIEENKTTQPLAQIYDKQWKSAAMEIAAAAPTDPLDAMDIDDPPTPAPPSRTTSVKAEILKPAWSIASRRQTREGLKIIDDPQTLLDEEGKVVHQKFSTPGSVPRSNVSTTGGPSASVTSPAMLNEQYHQIAEKTSQILNESAMRKLLAVDKSMFENNIEANNIIDMASQDIMLMFREHNVKIFNPSHIPTTKVDGSSIPSLPCLLRANIVRFLRAPVFELHEAPCVLGENCIGHSLFIQYTYLTANNTSAGPQFPPNTQSFTLRQLIMPDTEADIGRRLKGGESMAEIMRSVPPGLCILDTLNVAHKMIMKVSRPNENLAFASPTILQPFSIKVGVPGEYNSSCLLSCGSSNLTGLIEPFPELRFTNYIPYVYSVPLDGQKNAHCKEVLGWAEIDDIICEPSVGMKPRGYAPKRPLDATSEGAGQGYTF